MFIHYKLPYRMELNQDSFGSHVDKIQLGRMALLLRVLVEMTNQHLLWQTDLFHFRLLILILRFLL